MLRNLVWCCRFRSVPLVRPAASAKPRARCRQLTYYHLCAVCVCVSMERQSTNGSSIQCAHAQHTLCVCGCVVLRMRVTQSLTISAPHKHPCITRPEMTPPPPPLPPFVVRTGICILERVWCAVCIIIIMFAVRWTMLSDACRRSATEATGVMMHLILSEMFECENNK